MSVSSGHRLSWAQVLGPGSASASSSSRSIPPFRYFSEARITARILVNSAVPDISGSLSPPAADVFRRRTVVIHGQVLLQKLDRVPSTVRPLSAGASITEVANGMGEGPSGMCLGSL